MNGLETLMGRSWRGAGRGSGRAAGSSARVLSLSAVRAVAAFVPALATRARGGRRLRCGSDGGGVARRRQPGCVRLRLARRGRSAGSRARWGDLDLRAILEAREAG